MAALAPGVTRAYKRRRSRESLARCSAGVSGCTARAPRATAEGSRSFRYAAPPRAAAEARGCRGQPR
eukprot:909324-Alexandrium_andersonii.AAC.1